MVNDCPYKSVPPAAHQVAGAYIFMFACCPITGMMPLHEDICERKYLK